MQILKSLIAISAILFALHTTSAQNNFPIIGILTYPSEFPPQYSPENWSYFPASYVKWIQSAGARVVPIRYDLPAENITWLLSQLNGVLFTGGGVPILNANGSLNQLGQAMNTVIDYVLQSNRNGMYYPFWGTCEGFQMSTLIMADNYNLMIPVPGCEMVNKPIYFYNNVSDIPLMEWIPDMLQEYVQATNSCFFAHSYTVNPSSWWTIPYLEGNYTPLAYTYDTKNMSYIALISGKLYPMFGSQFHPEQVIFEYSGQNKNFQSIQFSQTLANWFVNQARNNTNTFPDQYQYLIYNFNPVPFQYQDFEQVYFFQNVNWTDSTPTSNPEVIEI